MTTYNTFGPHGTSVPVYSPFTGHWSDCPTYETLDAADCTCWQDEDPNCCWCGEPSNHEQGLVTVHSDGDCYHEDCWTAYKAHVHNASFVQAQVDSLSPWD